MTWLMIDKWLFYFPEYSVVRLYEIKTFCGTKEELPFPEPGDDLGDFVQRRIDMPLRGEWDKTCLILLSIESPYGRASYED